MMSQPEWENLASLLSVVIALLVFIAQWAGVFPFKWIGRFEQLFKRAAGAKIRWYILIPTIAFGFNALLATRSGLPRPIIHDEFSYLLAADTFSHGRLTNPPLPFFEHFETPHQLVRPSYMSKYPPGQGLAMAAGQLMCGEPIVGVWLSTALACAAIYWLLLGFVPAPWALLGGIVTAVHPELVDWSRVYWGGSLAVLGGALVVGAWSRLMLRGSISSGFWLGLGLLILANTRPYEGLVLAVPLILILVYRCCSIKAYHKAKLLWPVTVILVLGFSWMGYYNFRITGHVLRMPFMEYAEQYDVYPKFWFLPTRPVPEYRNASQRFVHTDFEKGIYPKLRTFSGLIDISWYRLRELIETAIKLMALFIPLVIGALKWSDTRLRWLLITVGVCVVGFWAESFVLPHYEAPVLPIFLLLVTLGWQRMNDQALGKKVPLKFMGKVSGVWLIRATVAGCLIAAIFSDLQPPGPGPQFVDQQRFVTLQPALQGGRHLVFVRYSPMHSLYHIEYVFNQSDLNSSRIIWARYFGPDTDLPVVRNFPGRQVWLLDVGGKLDLTRYSAVEARHN